MSDYPVVAECIDVRTGKRYFPGDAFPDPEADQKKRLVDAGCLKDEPTEAAKDKATAEALAAEKAAAEKAAAEKAAAEKAAAEKAAAEKAAAEKAAAEKAAAEGKKKS